jgi:predicted Fe-Mo cluster-binding NifX family protein
MKAAFAHWDNRIAPVFDTARRLRLVEADEGRLVGVADVSLGNDESVGKALELVNQGAGLLVCGAISRPLHDMIRSYGVEVVAFVAGDLDEVIQAWLSGRMHGEAFAMPGCCGRRRGRRRRAGGMRREA